MNENWKDPRLVALWEGVMSLVRDESFKEGKSVAQVAFDILVSYKQLNQLESELENIDGITRDKFKNFGISVSGYTIWQLLSLELIEWAIGNICDIGALTSKRDDVESRVLLRAFLKLQLHIQPLGEAKAIDPVPVLVPRHLLLELVDGLSALDRGEVRNLFKPRLTGRHNDPWSWDQMRTRALQYVEFFCGQGSQIGVARSRVADAMGISSDTLRAWKTDLVPTESIDPAFKAGQIKRLLDDNPNYGIDDGNIVDDRALYYLKEVMSQPLGEFGREYKTAYGARSNQ